MANKQARDALDTFDAENPEVAAAAEADRIAEQDAKRSARLAGRYID